jgi:hypothetical protein
MFKAVFASLIGTTAGLGLLAAATYFTFSSEFELFRSRPHLLFVVFFSCSLICAAAAWALVLSGIQLALQCAKATALALFAGWSVVMAAALTISQLVYESPSNSTIWLGCVVTGFCASFAAAGLWGFLLRGRALAIRSAVWISAITCLICAFPFTPFVLLYFQSIAFALGYIPFFIGSLLFGPALLKPNDTQGLKSPQGKLHSSSSDQP